MKKKLLFVGFGLLAIAGVLYGTGVVNQRAVTTQPLTIQPISNTVPFEEVVVSGQTNNLMELYSGSTLTFAVAYDGSLVNSYVTNLSQWSIFTGSAAERASATNLADAGVWGLFVGSAAQRAALTNDANHVTSYLFTNGDVIMWGAEVPRLTIGANHLVQLPGAATNYGKMWTFYLAATGTNGIFLSDGTTPVWTNTTAKRGVQIYCDGTNYFTLGGQ